MTTLPAEGAYPMEALLLSTLAVAIAEIGDKTQILALFLGARFQRPLPILSGILVATLANHGAAAALGAWLQSLLAPEVLRWGLGLSFLGLAAWTLKPDSLEAASPTLGRLGIFGITLAAFFLAEMGDKTQVATVALAASFDSAVAVVAGTTLGMMIANAPAVLLGAAAVERLPMPLVRLAAAGLFALFGLLILSGIGFGLPLDGSSSGL